MYHTNHKKETSGLTYMDNYIIWDCYHWMCWIYIWELQKLIKYIWGCYTYTRSKLSGLFAVTYQNIDKDNIMQWPVWPFLFFVTMWGNSDGGPNDILSNILTTPQTYELSCVPINKKCAPPHLKPCQLSSTMTSLPIYGGHHLQQWLWSPYTQHYSIHHLTDCQSTVPT